jgi:hypothetical protein
MRYHTCIAQVCGCFVILSDMSVLFGLYCLGFSPIQCFGRPHLFGRELVHWHPPSVPEAVRKLKYRENKFAFRCSPFLHPCLQRKVLDRCCIRGCGREISDGFCGIWSAPPTMPERDVRIASIIRTQILTEAIIRLSVLKVAQGCTARG